MLPPLKARTGGRVRVAIAGGGFAAAEALIALRHHAGDRVAIDLIAPQPELDLRPLAVTAPFGVEERRGVPLADLCADHRATLHRAAVTFADVRRHRLDLDDGSSVDHDAAIVATGARMRAAVEGALLFDGRRGAVELRRVLEGIDAGGAGTIVFAVPGGVTWSLPAYELALMTAMRAGDRARVVLVTPEPAPLALFGPAASRRLSALLRDRGVDVVCGSVPLRAVPAGLQTTTGLVAAQRVVALPRVEGPRFPGLHADEDGFVPVDEHGLVEGTSTVYAAGDLTAHPVKQGGLAAQQADVAAMAIAARVGAPVTPRPFAPVLRAMLLTGTLPLYVRGPGAAPAGASRVPLWQPTGKVAAKHLGPWLHDRLHARLGTAAPFADRAPRELARTADQEAAFDLALVLADDEAAAGDPGRALQWLEAAEAIEGVLPPEYVDKRRRWALGEPELVRTVGERWERRGRA